MVALTISDPWIWFRKNWFLLNFSLKWNCHPCWTSGQMKALESCYLLFPLGLQWTNLKQRFEHTHLLMNSPTKRSLLYQHAYLFLSDSPMWGLLKIDLWKHTGTQHLHPEVWCQPVRKLSRVQGSRGGLWFQWAQLHPLSMVHRRPHSNIEKSP